MTETTQTVNLARVAELCHTVNKAFCESIGDMTQVDWEDAPDWQKDSAIDGVVFHLLGERQPSDSHENWLKEKVSNGWTYGPVKDANKKEHPCIVPYDELSTEQKSKDYIFKSVCDFFKKYADEEV